jgi:hypothetical protein
MSEEVKNFIDKIADGDNSSAGDAFKDALRVKVGNSLDAHRQEVAGNMFNGSVEQPHSDPKPVIADPGTFNQDGSVSPTTNAGDGQADLDLSQPSPVGIDVDNAG